MSLSLVAFVTGPLMLQRRFLEENFCSVNSSFQKLQFFVISNFWKFRSVTAFSEQTTRIRQIFQLYWCRVKRTAVQQHATVRVGQFLLPKSLKFPTNQISANPVPEILSENHSVGCSFGKKKIFSHDLWTIKNVWHIFKHEIEKNPKKTLTSSNNIPGIVAKTKTLIKVTCRKLKRMKL